MIEWKWSSFEGLSRDELHQILQLRQKVFIVEQNCPYQDADHLDAVSWHLMGWDLETEARPLLAYLRVSFPGEKYPEPSLGRIVTAPVARGTGLGKLLMKEAISRTALQYPKQRIRISAQRYLERFYGEFGFETVSDPYDEDGIPHVEMLTKAT